MYKDLLSIGSVVQIQGEEQRVMICGRVVGKSGEDSIYDYIGCPYPQGITGTDEMRFFNRNEVVEVFFIGFQDPDELYFRREVLDKLGELEVSEGQIVPKTAEHDT